MDGWRSTASRGVLLDVGVHASMIIRNIYNSELPKEVYAETDTVRWSIQAEDTALVYYRFPASSVIVMLSYTEHAGYCRLEVDYPGATVVVDQRDGDNAEAYVVSNGHVEPIPFADGPMNSHTLDMLAFFDSVKDGRSHNGIHYVNDLMLVELAYRSAKARGPVEL